MECRSMTAFHWSHCKNDHDGSKFFQNVEEPCFEQKDIQGRCKCDFTSCFQCVKFQPSGLSNELQAVFSFDDEFIFWWHSSANEQPIGTLKMTLSLTIDLCRPPCQVAPTTSSLARCFEQRRRPPFVPIPFCQKRIFFRRWTRHTTLTRFLEKKKRKKRQQAFFVGVKFPFFAILIFFLHKDKTRSITNPSLPHNE